MTFLAIYHQTNLLNPVKLLTHREDISRVLEEASIRFDTLDSSIDLGRDRSDAQLLDSLGKHFGQYPHAEVIRLPPIPAYAAAPLEGDEPEQDCAGDGLRLLLQGRGVFCLHRKDLLYVLGCEGGDLVSVPAGVGHWFRQGTGPECVIARLAKTAEGLQCTPRIDGLAAGMELPDIY